MRLTPKTQKHFHKKISGSKKLCVRERRRKRAFKNEICLQVRKGIDITKRIDMRYLKNLEKERERGQGGEDGQRKRVDDREIKRKGDII